MSDWKVKIEYKRLNENKELETVVEKEYNFIDYTAMIHDDIRYIIADIEDAFYTFSGCKMKEDWTPEMKTRFKKIRHKLLDQANAIKRLPETLSYKGIKANQLSITDFIDKTMK